MTHFKWTHEAEATLRRLYPIASITCIEIGERIGCKPRAVVRKAARLGLVSPRRHKTGPRTRVVRYRPMGEETRRFVGWFVSAGWPPHEVARLFDVHPAQVVA